MILRVVLGVVLTAAMVAAAAPAMSVGSADAADSTVQRQLDALSGDLETMVDTDDPTGGPGARHVAEIRLPARTLTSAGVARLRFSTRGDVGVATWRVGDDRTGRTRLAGVPIRADGGHLTLRESGTHRLAFGLRARSNGPVLTVRRLGGERDA